MENMSISTIIISIIIFAGTLAFLYFTGQKNKIRAKVIELVEEAEKKFGSSDSANSIKYNYVVAYINKYIPPKIKPFITDAMIDQFIEDGLYILKDKIDDDKLNNSYPK